MPLIQLQPIHELSAWALWRIDEDLDELGRLELCDQERADLEMIHNGRRRMEWLGARNALHKIIESQMIEKMNIRKDSFGKPFLVDSSHHISIAHSFPYAAAIFNRMNPVGIDLEKIQSKVRKIEGKFLSDDEISSCNGDIVKLTVYWCAKEALYKLYGRKLLIFRENLHIEPFQMSGEGKIIGAISIGDWRQSIGLRYQRLEDYIICYTI